MSDNTATTSTGFTLTYNDNNTITCYLGTYNRGTFNDLKELW